MSKEGWARPDTRNSKTRHYFVNGRSLCRVWGIDQRSRLDPEHKPAQDCQHCHRTLLERGTYG